MHRKALVAMLAAVIVMALPQLAGAQNNGTQAFIFAAPGGESPGGSSLLHLGGGAEGFLHGGPVAISGDLGYMTPMAHWGSGVGILDLDGGYHWNTRDKKITPFVSGGYTLGFRDGHFNAMNFGGGVNVWMSRHNGLRLEFRDIYHPGTYSFQYINVRIGLTFR